MKFGASCKTDGYLEFNLLPNLFFFYCRGYLDIGLTFWIWEVYVSFGEEA